MKKIPLIGLLFICYICHAQKVIIFKDGAAEQHEINWAAESGVRIERNRFVRHDRIDSIQIIQNGKLSGQLARFYKITSNSAAYRPVSPIIVQQQNTDPMYAQPTVNTVSSDGTSHPGAALEMLGALTLTAYFILSNSYVNEVKDNPTTTTAKPPSLIIPAAGAGAMSLGFIIDLSSGGKKK
jgi:hypothetical protein